MGACLTCKGWCAKVDDSWFYRSRGKGINAHDMANKCQQCNKYYPKEQHSRRIYCFCCGQQLRYKSRSRNQRLSKEPDPWIKRPIDPVPLGEGEEEDEDEY